MAGMVTGTPTNNNFLSPLNFNFKLRRAPNLNFFLQKISMPAMTINSFMQGNPFVNIPRPGEHITFGKLEITFKVDEDLQNYMELYSWIRGLGKPQEFEEYAALANVLPGDAGGISSDIVVLVENSLKVPNYQIVFEDAHPITLTGMEFQTTDSTVNYVSAQAAFAFVQYKIEKI